MAKERSIIGTRVTHATFGAGVVTGVDASSGRTHFVVKFDAGPAQTVEPDTLAPEGGKPEGGHNES